MWTDGIKAGNTNWFYKLTLKCSGKLPSLFNIYFRLKTKILMSIRNTTLNTHSVEHFVRRGSSQICTTWTHRRCVAGEGLNQGSLVHTCLQWAGLQHRNGQVTELELLVDHRNNTHVFDGHPNRSSCYILTCRHISAHIQLQIYTPKLYASIFVHHSWKETVFLICLCMIHLTELDFSVDSEQLAPRQRAGVDLDVRDLQGISRFACSRYKCLRQWSWTSMKSSTLTAVAPDTIRLVLVVHGTSLLHRRRRIKTVPADCIRRTLQRHRPELHEHSNNKNTERSYRIHCWSAARSFNSLAHLVCA